MKTELTAVYQKLPQGSIAFVEELPGADTQGATLEEARANLQEAIQLVLDADRPLAAEAVQWAEVLRETLSVSAP